MRLETTEGATLVDYELPDHTDKPRKLSVLQGDDPMILTLNRGFYCPKDRMQLLELARFSKQCAVGYTRLVTITTDNLLQSNELRLGVGGHSCTIRSASSRRTWTSPSTPTRRTIP
jgi:hypothetical protein